DLRGAHELAHDGEPLLPPTRQRVDRGLEVGEARPSDGRRDPAVIVAAMAGAENVRDRLPALEARILWDVADPDLPPQRARPGVRRLEAGEYLEQRRLAGAVRT